jgi:hypothetical protein
MANYLQRIVVSGARIISPAKPPVSSHTLTPPVAAPVFSTAAETSLHADEFSEPVLAKRTEPLQIVEHPHVVQEHDAVPSAASPTPEPVMEKNPSVPQGVPAVWPLTPILSSPSERVRAPEGLRRVRPNIMPQQEMIRDVVKLPRKQEVQAEVKHVSESFESLPGPAHSEATPVPAEISKHEQSRPIPDSAQTLTTKALVAPIDSPVTNAEVLPERVSAQALPPIQRVVTDTANTDRKVEIPATPPATPKLPIETQPNEVRTAALRKAVLPTVSNSVDKRRQSKISIGRIDVQVNNQLPPQPTGPQAAKPSSSSNFLDTRYLSRFFLRL